MTSNVEITNTELEAIRSVERALGGRILPPKLESISEDVDKLTWLLKRLKPATPAEHVAAEPLEDSQGPSVIDRRSREIEWRWAKETIGLVSVELNEAYAQFEIDRDGHTIPSGILNNAAKRLEEAMDRLGLIREADIPF